MNPGLVHDDLARFGGLRINRAAEFAGMAVLAQVELLTRTLVPSLRDEFERLAADDQLLFRLEEATAVAALEAEIFCRPSDAILGFVSRIGAAVAASDIGLEILVSLIHGWPYPVVRLLEDMSA